MAKYIIFYYVNDFIQTSHSDISNKSYMAVSNRYPHDIFRRDRSWIIISDS